MKEVDVQIRRALGLNDYERIVQLEKEVWGYTEMEDLAAVPILMIANRFGGAVLIAEEPSGRAVGFSMANLGWTEEKKLFWWSHMTAVVNDYRNKDLGFRLKMRQREEALAAGIDAIHWTFDPLQAMNAHFNIRKLGAIARHYEENVYGFSRSPLHQGLPTDRLVAEWRLNDDRSTSATSRDLETARRIAGADSEPDLGLKESPLLLEIPADINDLRQRDLAAARIWQARIRTAFLHYFHEGYAVVGFIREEVPKPQAFYILENNTR